MPTLQAIVVTTDELRRDDVILRAENRNAEGDVVISKSFGRTRWTVTFLNGPDRAFPSDARFTVDRMMPTEDEQAAADRRSKIHALDLVLDRIDTDRHETILRDALESENGVYLDSSRLSALIEHQERARYAAWIAETNSRYLAATGDELLALMGAFGFLVFRREDRYPRSPLSRSTSTTSNLIEDVAKFVEDDLIHDAGHHGRWSPADFLAAYESCLSIIRAADEAA